MISVYLTAHGKGDTINRLLLLIVMKFPFGHSFSRNIIMPFLWPIYFTPRLYRSRRAKAAFGITANFSIYRGVPTLSTLASRMFKRTSQFFKNPTTTHRSYYNKIMPPHTTYDAKFVVSFEAEHAEACHPTAKGPLSPLPAQTRKSVSFDERVRAKKTIHFADFAEEEITACWYAEDDFRRFKRDVRFEANLLENECLQADNVKYCSRGLECFTTSGSKQRSANKRQSIALVLEEQEMQRDEGSHDAAFIAEIYADVVVPCKAVALANAQ